ncbi:UNKNOWN [Stylonychia lemnae]|uniref:Uncharacterized protein n=1 Tax=Stylonychia lemnae TaxID=5949 RepID=A0A078A4S5_STYLE|nr:UNKNOWN [Stylonychia lemnae]|eukprot:CDW77275.1 UNKNOWN [Stylonychia lemnae]
MNRSRYNSIYNNAEAPSNLYYYQSSSKQNTCIQNSPQSLINASQLLVQNFESSCRKHRQQVNLAKIQQEIQSYANPLSKELKSLQNERLRRKQKSTNGGDEIGESQDINEQTFSELKQKRPKVMNMSFKEKRESILRKKSQNNREPSEESHKVIENCKRKLQKFEKQWIIFKENLETHNNPLSAVKEQYANKLIKADKNCRQINEELAKTLVEQLTHNGCATASRASRKNTGNGIVGSFYRTRSQSPGFNTILKTELGEKESKIFTNHQNNLNSSLRKSQGPILTQISQNFEEKVLKQIQNIQTSLFTTQSNSKQQASRNTEDKPMKVLSTQIKAPFNKANYFSEQLESDQLRIVNRGPFKNLNKRQSVCNTSQKPQLAHQSFQVRMTSKQTDQPVAKRQMSERSLVKSNMSCHNSVQNLIQCSQANLQSFETDTRDEQIQLVQRSFMTKCKMMGDKNMSCSSQTNLRLKNSQQQQQQQSQEYRPLNQSTNISLNNVNSLSISSQKPQHTTASNVISNMKTINYQQASKMKKINAKITYNQVSGDSTTDSSIQRSPDMQRESKFQTIQQYNLVCNTNSINNRNYQNLKSYQSYLSQNISKRASQLDQSKTLGHQPKQQLSAQGHHQYIINSQQKTQANIQLIRKSENWPQYYQSNQ